MNLEQEFNKETGNNSYDTVNCHYTGHYVEWLESKIEAIKEASSKELNEKQHREILEEFAEEYNYPHNSKVDCVTKEDIDSYLKDKSIL